MNPKSAAVERTELSTTFLLVASPWFSPNTDPFYIYVLPKSTSKHFCNSNVIAAEYLSDILLNLPIFFVKMAAACYHLPWEEISHRPPLSLLQLCRERIVLMSLRAVRRIQSGGRLGWLGWPFTCIPNFEPKAFKRHGIRQLQSYLTSVPHMYNELVSGNDHSQCGNLRI